MDAKTRTGIFEITESVDFETLYREQMPRVYNFFLYRFTDRALAEDLTSLTFEKTWKYRHRYRRDLCAFSTWIFTIARRVAIDHYRRPSLEESIDETVQSANEENLEDFVQKRHDLNALRLLLGHQPARERELISLKYGAGLSNQTIAKLTGLSESNVGVILFRTVQTLREKWKALDE